MATLTPNQIGLCIYEAGNFGPGGTKERVIEFFDIAIAVALSESSGNTNAKNPSGATGLWQIMMPLHKDLADKWSEYWWAEDGWPGKNVDPPKGYRKPDILDPRVNTSVAGQLYQQAGKTFAPWEVYLNKSYKKHLGHGKAVYEYLNSPERIKKGMEELRQEVLLGRETFETGAAVLSPLVAAASDPGSMLDKALGFLRDAGMTVGVFLIALILVILGVWFLMDKPLPPVAKVIKAAT